MLWVCVHLLPGKEMSRQAEDISSWKRTGTCFVIIFTTGMTLRIIWSGIQSWIPPLRQDTNIPKCTKPLAGNTNWNWICRYGSNDYTHSGPGRILTPISDAVLRPRDHCYDILSTSDCKYIIYIWSRPIITAVSEIHKQHEYGGHRANEVCNVPKKHSDKTESITKDFWEIASEHISDGLSQVTYMPGGLRLCEDLFCEINANEHTLCR